MVSKSKLEKFVAGEFATPSLERSLMDEAAMFGGVHGEPALRGLVACRLGLRVESVSRLLDWKSFEKFCGSVLKASGFKVAENLTFTRPRMQLDLVASDTSVVLSVDCKHWASSGGSAVLSNAARKQIERSRRLRGSFIPGDRPIVTAIVTMTEQPSRFVEGAAVVPIHTLVDFARSAMSYLDRLEVV